jgi:hypothetical protein
MERGLRRVAQADGKPVSPSTKLDFVLDTNAARVLRPRVRGPLACRAGRVEAPRADNRMDPSSPQRVDGQHPRPQGGARHSGHSRGSERRPPHGRSRHWTIEPSDDAWNADADTIGEFADAVRDMAWQNGFTPNEALR